MTPDDPHPPEGTARPEEPLRVPGSLADEAGRLIEVFSSWAGQGSSQGGAGAAAQDESGADPGGAAHPETCRYCPLCRLLATLRGERPDLAAQLADSGTALAQAGAAFAEALRAAFVPAGPAEAGPFTGPPRGSAEQTLHEPPSDEPPHEEPPPAERIDVR